MKNLNKQEKVGLALLIIGILFFVSEKILIIETLSSISKYGKYIFMAGAAIWFAGYRQRVKHSKDK